MMVQQVSVTSTTEVFPEDPPEKDPVLRWIESDAWKRLRAP